MATREGLTVRVAGVALVGDRLVLTGHSRNGEAYWVLPGGHLEVGEPVAEALAREFREETGLEVQPRGLLYLSDFLPSDRQVVDLVFRVAVTGGYLTKGGDPEAVDCRAALRSVRLVRHKELACLDFRPPALRPRLLEDWEQGFPDRGVYLGDLSA